MSAHNYDSYSFFLFMFDLSLSSHLERHLQDHGRLPVEHMNRIVRSSTRTTGRAIHKVEKY